MKPRESRVLRLLLRLYPLEFRERYGRAILAFYTERFDDARRRGERPRRVWRRTLVDLVSSAAAEHFAERDRLNTRSTDQPAHPSSALSTEDQMFVFAQEIAYAARTLRRSVGFSLAAVLTLALGISSTTAIFSVVESVLLRPLPFPRPEQLVVPQSRSMTSGETSSVTYADFMDWRDHHVFDKVAVYQETQMDLTGPAEPVRVAAAAVGPEFFAALAARPALGRTLQATDFPLDAPRAVVISDRLWRTQFGGEVDVVGRAFEINGIKRPIVGVLAAGTAWPVGADLWVPLRFTTEQDPDLQRRDNYIFSAVARLAPDRTVETTRTIMATLARQAEAAHPDIRKNVTTLPVPMLDWALGPTTPKALWILLGAVGLLLLIACVNVANLQLARAASRERELALRTALGASRFRLVRQMLVESGVLSLAGAAVGVLAAHWLVKAIVAVAPTDVPRIDAASLDITAVTIAVGASLVVAILFGLLPALYAARRAPNLSLGESGTRLTTGRSGARTRRALVVLELALSVVLLVGASLAIRSIMKLRGADSGFDTRHVLTASISLPGIRYDSARKVIAFMYGLRERLATAPGIDAAGISSASPLGAGGFYLGRSMIAEGRGTGPAGEVSVQWNVTTPGYFAALRVAMTRGRDFTARDDSTSPPVMIVNEAFAKAMFPQQNPIGKRAMSSRDEKVYREIVGVVKDVKYYGASDTARALVWVPYAQKNAWHQGIITVHTRGNPAAALPVVKRELRALDPAIALANVTTMDEAMARSMAGDRLVAILLGAFASLALLLAAVGVFGVQAYMVERRRHELGIRLALGAQAADVVGLVARETLPMVCAGLVIGVMIALGLTRFLRSMLYEVAPGDPVTFAGVVGLLGAIAVAAALMPLRRALRVDPVIALRNE
jgi:putative ABC transport system permease protein